MKTALRVLIIEDSQDDYLLLLHELEQAGYDSIHHRVETAPALKEALDRQEWDVIISDFQMPRFSGMAALKEVRDRGLETPFILASGTIGEEEAARAIHEGADDYILKDRLARLGLAVTQAMEASRLRADRKGVEEELRATHTQLRQLLAHSPAILYTLKLEGRNITPTIVSENIERMLGVAAAESTSLEWWLASLHPEDRECVLSEIAQGLSQTGFSLEYRIRHKDGTYRWIQDNNRVIRDACGKPVEAVGVWTEITERKRLEEEVSLREKRLASFFTGATAGLALLDSEMRFVQTNDTLDQMMGMTAKEHMGKTAQELLPALAPTIVPMLKTILKSGEPVLNLELSGETPDRPGELRHWINSLFPITGRDGKPEGIGAIVVEITDRKRAEKVQHESERRFREMLENVDLIAITLDTQGKITFCNDCLLRLTGWERSEVMGEDWFSRFIPAGDTAIKGLFFQTIHRGTTPCHHENAIATREGQIREIAWNNTLLRDPQGNIVGIASLGDDVTERKRAEESRAALALKNESFVRAMGEIVYDHDIPGNLIEWGGNPEKCLGWTLSELGSSPEDWQQLIHPDDIPRVLAELELSSTKSVITSEYRFRHKTGHYVWMADRGVVSRDAEGRAIRFIGIMQDISQRRRVEEELQSRTAFSEALLDSSLHGILVLDAQRNILLKNQRFLDIWKMPPELVKDKDDSKRVEFVMNQTKNPQEFGDKVNYLYAHPEETSRDEIELVNGTVLDRTSAPVHDTTGKYYGRVWNFHDITDLKRAEHRIADSLNFNRKMLEASPLGIVTYHSSGANVLQNEAAARLIGATREQLASTNFRQISTWKTTGLLAVAERALQSGLEEQLEVHFITTYGREVWLAWRFVSFQHDDELHLLAMFTDISGRKRSEAALQESQERFQQLAENMEEVFWMTDAIDGRILYVSPGYETIWGRSCESVYQSPSTRMDAVHPEDREQVLQAIRQKEGGQYDEVYRIVRPDQSVRWIRDRAFPIRNQRGQVYRVGGVAEDITEQRRLEQQVRQAQKMEAIGTLAGGIAHDFNNILGAMAGYTELAKLDCNGNPNVLEHLEAVSQAGQRAADLVRQILAFSRQQAQERKLIRLHLIVAEVLKLLRATIPATITFKASLASDTQTVLADTTQIHQIMMNLSTNAWFAMKDRPGQLEVLLENFRVDEAFAELHPELRQVTYVRLSISDTGSGMDQATLNRIFEPFFTTKAPGEGTGLGLAVVHGIMQAHEGAITVHSHPGLGTTFRLYFPAHEEEADVSTIPPSAIPMGKGERILFVDDETSLAKIGKKVLERFGYKVEAYTNATEALTTLRANPDMFDLVITDLAMPGMTGTDFARFVLQMQPALPILLMTGYASNQTLERTAALGIREILMKPLTLETLGTAVHRALNFKKAT